MKRIFKTLVVAAALTFGSSAFAAQYLWWTADASQYAQTSYAKVAMYNGTTNLGYLNVADSMGADSGNAMYTATDGLAFYEQLSVIGSTVLESYSFVCELYDSTGTLLASSDAMSYASAKLFEDWSSGMAANGSESEFTFSIPEPTSGMLVLVGLGLLALRRKHA